MTTITTSASRFIRFTGWLFLILMLWLSFGRVALAEKITSFQSEITVNDDSSLEVVETIVYDFGLEYRHGIFRNIRDKHALSASVWYKQRYIGIEVLSVTKDGIAEPYTLESYDGISAKIGRADKTIAGEHVYQIKYLVTGALSDSSEGVELYWNVTGDDWSVEILQTMAVIKGSSQVKLGSENYCYAGVDDSTGQCQDIVSSRYSTQFTQGVLNAGQQLTVAQSLVLPKAPVILERYNSFLLWFVGIVIGLFLLIMSIYRWRTKYKISRPVIAQYEPYKDFRPMFTGVLFDNRLDSRDISAGIVYLAQQGFISIREIKSKVLFLFDYTDYELYLLRSDTETDCDFEKSLLRMLFGYAGKTGHTVSLSDIKSNNSKLSLNKQIINIPRAYARGITEHSVFGVSQTT